jgi:hypothetical protein
MEIAKNASFSREIVTFVRSWSRQPGVLSWKMIARHHLKVHPGKVRDLLGKSGGASRTGACGAAPTASIFLASSFPAPKQNPRPPTK